MSDPVTTSDHSDDPAKSGDFGGRSVEWWRDWFREFLDHHPVSPSLPVLSHGYYQAIENLYDDLTSITDRERFASGIADALEFTPVHQRYAERMYYLIDLVALTKPLRGKNILRSLLENRVFLSLEYGETILHWSALSALTKYDVDHATVELVLRLAEGQRDIFFLLTCARVLSYSFNAQLTYGFLARIVPLITSENSGEVKRRLRSVIKRLGRKGLLEWYQGDVLGLQGKQLGFRHPSQIERLRSILERLVPWKEFQDAIDPYELLTAAQFATGTRPLSVFDVRLIARSHEGVSREHIVIVLKTLYSSTFEDPIWELMDNDDENFAPYAQPGIQLLYSRGEVLELDVRRDADAIGLLKEAKSRALVGEEDIVMKDPAAFARQRVQHIASTT